MESLRRIAFKLRLATHLFITLAVFFIHSRQRIAKKALVFTLTIIVGALAAIGLQQTQPTPPPSQELFIPNNPHAILNLTTEEVDFAREKLEDLHAKQPHSLTVLKNLYLLEKNTVGNTATAQSYLDQIKVLDPTFTIEVVEK